MARGLGNREDRELAPVCPLAFGRHERAATHAFHTTRDEQLPLAARDGAERIDHGGQTAGAQPVDRHTGHFDRQTGQEPRTTRHIPTVLPRLVGTPGNDILDILSAKRAARHHRRDSTGQ